MNVSEKISKTEGMKRERNDDDDARAPGSPPRGLE